MKNTVFKSIKAYNLVQTFEFMTVTFQLYYECRLLAVTYNRMDRYLSLHFKGLGASSIAESDITPSQSSPNTHTAKSHKYQVDTAAWNCNWSVGQYLDGLHKFFTTYLDTVERTEPMTSATPHLSTLLHTYFKKPSSMTSNAGCRRIHVQPTALSRRREGIPKGSQCAPAGRPPKRLLEQSDCHIQTNRDQQDHVKRKQS